MVGPLVNFSDCITGSSIENWHSIMRNGLVSASGTKLQVNGQAYGAGIYISPSVCQQMNSFHSNANQAATSFGYCRIPNYNYGGYRSNPYHDDDILNTSTDPNNLGCIAICEGSFSWLSVLIPSVVNKDIKKATSDIWVQPHTNYVMTRFFMVYLNGIVGTASNCHTENSAFEKELRASIEYFVQND